MTFKKMQTLVSVLGIVFLMISTQALRAAVRLPAVIGDHMVLQQSKPIPVWGWAEPGEKVAVRLSGQEMTTHASEDGRWRVVFPPLQAGGRPVEMAVRGEKGPEISVQDILVGEVWVCSGQSNMEWPLSLTTSSTPEILRADHPGIRLFLVPQRTADRPQEDVEAEWTLCTPETAAPFSAVAFHFGLELHHKLGIPVGLIEAAWGGTAIEPWTPPAGFSAVPETAAIMDELERRNGEYWRPITMPITGKTRGETFRISSACL
ncbi:MAG: sialate O-acetylesterase [Candidatus Aminicenantales bacterium]